MKRKLLRNPTPAELKAHAAKYAKKRAHTCAREAISGHQFVVPQTRQALVDLGYYPTQKIDPLRFVAERAMLHTMIDRLDGLDLHALFGLAGTFLRFPKPMNFYKEQAEREAAFLNQQAEREKERAWRNGTDIPAVFREFILKDMDLDEPGDPQEV